MVGDTVIYAADLPEPELEAVEVISNTASAGVTGRIGHAAAQQAVASLTAAGFEIGKKETPHGTSK